MYIVEIKNGDDVTEIHGVKEKMKSGIVVKGINTIDSFSFALLPANSGFNSVRDMQTLVSVYDTRRKRYEFYGRVLYSKASMEATGKILKNVLCESYFGFLCDSLQMYVKEQNWTVLGLLQHIVDIHNSQVEDYKKFHIGEVNVTDPNNNLYVGIQIDNSWNTLKTKLIDKLGGEIRFRVVDGEIYLDYLEEIGEKLTTEIALSKNMKSITREDNPTSYISRLIPLGYKLKDEEGIETGERLDITSVNGGLNYIESKEAVAKYGIRYGYVFFDDVTLPSRLLEKGITYLAKHNKVQVKYTITALELSLLGLNINDLDVYNYHPIKNKLLFIDDVARIIKKKIDVVNDNANSSIEVGDNFKTLSDLQNEREQAFKESIQKMENSQIELKEFASEKTNQTNNELQQVILENYTSIINDCTAIIMTAVESYTEIGDFEKLKELTESSLKYMSDNMTLQFKEMTTKLDNVNGDLQEKFNLITKYFTFDIDGLTIGQVDNPYKVIIDNDRYSMTLNDIEVLWIDAITGEVHTPRITVTEGMSVLGYIEEMDNEGRINTRWAGGE